MAHDHPSPGWNFDNSYARLPASFHIRQHPVPVRAPRLVAFNRRLAEALGLDAERLAGESGWLVLSGSAIPENSEPIAQAYAGHQFGNFTMLGDGRALLLGEQIAPDGGRWDIQLKGSGATPFSRRGDGRAALGPMLREYLVSEAMHALGIPTTRSLAVVATGEPVYRDDILPGAVLTRVAASHIRVGTFEYAALRGEEAQRALADYTIARHYPELAEAANPYLALLDAVIDRQAALVAQWMQVGFIHGVMNTDNMAISGETIDYGPCAFMDAYDPATTFSSIDLNGRYAFGNQPSIAQWNLARFAETLLPLLHADTEQAIALAEAAIHRFPRQYEQVWLAGMRTKLGLPDETAEDLALVNDLLACMHRHGMDYPNTFRTLAMGPIQETEQTSAGTDHPDFRAWRARWQNRLNSRGTPAEDVLQTMRAANPAVIPRNHLVEAALEAVVRDDDFAPFEKLMEVLSSPYESKPGNEAYSRPAPPSNFAYRTFCGT